MTSEILRSTRRLVFAFFLTAAAIVSAQCYEFSGANITLQIDITSVPQPAPLQPANGAGVTFLGNTSLTIGGVATSSSAPYNTGAAVIVYNPGVSGVQDPSTLFVIDADTLPDPSNILSMVNWSVELSGLGDLIPSLALPQVLPPLSAWVDPDLDPFPGITSNYIQVITDTGSNKYPITAIGDCSPPGPNIVSVVSGASFLPGIVPNSWVAVYGTNLSPVTDFWTTVNAQLPTKLDGVSVSIDGQPAYVEFVSSGQINVLAPNIGAGPMQVTVTNSLGTSAAVSATSATYVPAFFLWANQYAVATYQNYTYAVKNGVIAGVATAPAAPGEVLILWGTGFGPTTPAAPAGEEVPATATYWTTDQVTVTIGGISATVYGAALAPGFAGLYQIAIQVPASAPNGDQPIVAEVGGAFSPSGTLITIQQ